MKTITITVPTGYEGVVTAEYLERVVKDLIRSKIIDDARTAQNTKVETDTGKVTCVEI